MTPTAKDIPLPSDPEVREVILAYRMLKGFKTGCQFAQNRVDQLSETALDKTLLYVVGVLKEQLNEH